MAGVKECSAGYLDSIFSYLYASTVRIIVTTSSSPTCLASASSNSKALVVSTNPSYPTTAYFSVVGSSGTNRYISISACSCDDVKQAGAATCVIIFNVTCSEVIYVTTCACQELTTGKANIGTWSITVQQPV